MSNCCMRRSAKFHVDSAVSFWAIANIREGGGCQTPPPVKRGLIDSPGSFPTAISDNQVIQNRKSSQQYVYIQITKLMCYIASAATSWNMQESS